MAKRRQEDEADVLARAETVTRAKLAATGGKAIIDMLWDRLDEYVDCLMSPPIGNHDEQVKGQAQSMAEAISIMTNPYDPDMAKVRAEAMERYAARQKPKPVARKRARRAI